MKYSLDNYYGAGDDLFASFFPRINPSFSGQNLDSEVKSTDKGAEIHLALPGFSKKDISIKIEDGFIRVTGKQSYSDKFSNEIDRNYAIGDKIDTKQIKAKLENGILLINLPFKKKSSININID
tara:strand:+ start:112 stop:483 length:372 start_codon:yes stop_codon:yes gene_type:complete